MRGILRERDARGLRAYRWEPDGLSVADACPRFDVDEEAHASGLDACSSCLVIFHATRWDLFTLCAVVPFFHRGISRK